MHSPGLEILATHRVVRGLAKFDGAALVEKVNARKLGSLDELRGFFQTPAPGKVRMGIALPGGVFLTERERQPGELDVKILHAELLGKILGLSEDSVREEKNLEYVRGLDAAVAKLRDGNAQLAFLLEPTTIEQVAEVAFSGGVMPQKSTDFYPKLLSGMTIYKLED